MDESHFDYVLEGGFRYSLHYNELKKRFILINKSLFNRCSPR